MQDALSVRGDERGEHLFEERSELEERQRGAAGDAGAKGLAFEPLHDEIGMPVLGAAEIVDLADVRVPDGRNHPSFVAQPAQAVALLALTGPEHLERYHSVQPEMPCLVHGTHPALTEQRIDRVLGIDHAADPARHVELLYRVTRPMAQAPRSRPFHVQA